MVASISRTPVKDTSKQRNWDVIARTRALQMHLDGLSKEDIEAEVGIPLRTQTRIFTAGLDGLVPSRQQQDNRLGRSKKIDKPLLLDMIEYAVKSFDYRRLKWPDIARHFGLDCHARTLANHFHAAGYYKCRACRKSYLREANVRKREEYCRQARSWSRQYWKQFRFTDESHFDVDSRSTAWIIRQTRASERSCTVCIQFNKRSRGPALHAWAMVGYNFKSKLHFYDTNVIDYDPAWQKEADEQHEDPQPSRHVRETEDEESNLMQTPKCRHPCKDKTACKHSCCKAGYKKLKGGGNLNQTQYLEWFLKEIIPLYLKGQQGVVVLEDNDGSHGTRTEDNPCAPLEAILAAGVWHSLPSKYTSRPQYY